MFDRSDGITPEALQYLKDAASRMILDIAAAAERDPDTVLILFADYKTAFDTVKEMLSSEIAVRRIAVLFSHSADKALPVANPAVKALKIPGWSFTASAS